MMVLVMDYSDGSGNGGGNCDGYHDDDIDGDVGGVMVIHYNSPSHYHT